MTRKPINIHHFSRALRAAGFLRLADFLSWLTSVPRRVSLAPIPLLVLVNVSLLICIVGFSIAIPRAAASGFWDPRVINSFRLFPDLQLDAFANGEIGILRPSFARSYLLVAYRYLTGTPLNGDEQKSVKDLWNFRRGMSSPSSQSSSAESVTAVSKWLSARRKVSGAKDIADLDVRSCGPDTISFLNCEDEAFLAASRTLDERIKKFGAGSEEMRDWLDAQDKVFCNCRVDPGHYRDWENPPAPTGPILPGSSTDDGRATVVTAQKDNQIISIKTEPSSTKNGEMSITIQIEKQRQ